MFGHKPTFGLVKWLKLSSHDDRRVVKLLPASDISVRGPLARCAEDLRVSMEIISSTPKDDGDKVDTSLTLPRSNKCKMSSFRIALIRSLPICPTSMEIRCAVENLAVKLRAAGAEVIYLDEENGKSLPFDPYEMMRVYLTLLGCTMLSQQVMTASDAFGMKGEELQQMILDDAARFSEDDNSLEAVAARAPLTSYGEWKKADARRQELRIVWQDFFTPAFCTKMDVDTSSDQYDFLICPAFARCAFPHDHSGIDFHPFWRENGRKIEVDGKPGPYQRHVFWSALTGTCFLPSTVFPTGLGKDSRMPIGLQVVGPELSDFKTIDFVRLLEKDLGYAFQKPTNEFGND